MEGVIVTVRVTDVVSVLIRFIFDENVDGFFTKTFFVKVL